MISRTKWIAGLLVLGCIVASTRASDESDVKDAAKNFAMALAKGDATQAKKYATSDEATTTVIDALSPIIVANQKLSDAAVAKFGEAGKSLATGSPGPMMGDWSKRAEESVVTIDSKTNTATMVAKDDAQTKSSPSAPATRPSQPLQLKKEGGAWKVDFSNMPNVGQMKGQAPLFQAMSKAMSDTADEVKAGKFQSVAEAKAAMQQKLIAAMMNGRGGFAPRGGGQ